MIFEGLQMVLGWDSLLAILVGTFIGVIIGVIPGIGSGAGMALLLPLVFYLPPHVGLLVLLSLWQADGYGASISSILINVPGGSGAAFTCLDGYPLAKQGKAGLAMGLSMGSSRYRWFYGDRCPDASGPSHRQSRRHVQLGRLLRPRPSSGSSW